MQTINLKSTATDEQNGTWVEQRIHRDMKLQELTCFFFENHVNFLDTQMTQSIVSN